MKTRRYSEVQIFRILQEVDSGKPVVIAAREHEVSPATIHRWKGKYGVKPLSCMRYLQRIRWAECRQCRRLEPSAGTSMDLGRDSS